MEAAFAVPLLSGVVLGAAFLLLVLPVMLLGVAVLGLLLTEGILLEVEVAELGRLGMRLGPPDLFEGSDESTGLKTYTQKRRMNEKK